MVVGNRVQFLLWSHPPLALCSFPFLTRTLEHTAGTDGDTCLWSSEAGWAEAGCAFVTRNGPCTGAEDRSLRAHRA